MHIVQKIRTTMQAKLVVAMTALILAVVILFGSVIYMQTSRTIEQDLERLSKQVLTQANLNLERYFKGYEQVFLLLSYSKELGAWLRVEQGNSLDSYLIFSEIRDIYVTPYIFQYPEIISVMLHNRNGNDIHYSFKYGIHKDYEFNEADWAPFTDNYRMEVRIAKEYLGDNSRSLEIPVMSLIRKVNYGPQTGVLKIDIDLAPALQIVNELGLGKTGYGFFASGDGKILVHPEQDKITTQLPDELQREIEKQDEGFFFREDTKEYVLYKSIGNKDWKTVIVLPYREFASSSIFIRNFTIMVAGLALILASLVAIKISKSITTRLGKLREIIKRTKVGKFDVKANIGGADEVAEVGLAYNEMLESLDHAVNELAQTKIAEQKAVLSALQSQIDSHFLYNALESINSMANLEGHRQIEQTTIALSKMLRYTSDFKSSVVRVKEEVQHLLNYLNIMKIRMGDDFEYEIHVHPDCESGYCLKAIMQPIAENSMKHAVVPMGMPLRMTVDLSISTFGGLPYIQMRIADNGLGFSKEKLARIHEELRQISLSPLNHQHSNIGLLNIHFRLKMYYAKDPYAGIAVENCTSGSGAVITIVFPLQKQPKQEVDMR